MAMQERTKPVKGKLLPACTNRLVHQHFNYDKGDAQGSLGDESDWKSWTRSFLWAAGESGGWYVDSRRMKAGLCSETWNMELDRLTGYDIKSTCLFRISLHPMYKTLWHIIVWSWGEEKSICSSIPHGLTQTIGYQCGDDVPTIEHGNLFK